MKHFAICGIVAFVLAGAGVAQAAERQGLYLSGSGAWTTTSNDLKLTDLEGDNTGPIADHKYELDDGYAITAAVGYSFGQGFRVEGEVGYRNNDVDKLQIGAVTFANSNADFQATSAMVNALIDVPLGEKFFLYGGIGGGVVVADIDDNSLADDDDLFIGALAYQIMAGVGVNVTEHVAITAGYRLFSAFKSEFDDLDIDDSRNDELDGDIRFPVFHEVSVGLRYTF